MNTLQHTRRAASNSARTHLFVTFVVTLTSTACFSAAMVPEIANMVGGAGAENRKVDVVLGPDVSAATLQAKKSAGISFRGSESGDVYGMTGGNAPNPAVVADLVSKELLRLGMQARVIADDVNETMSAAERKNLRAEGFDLILIGNFTVTTSMNYKAALTGGEMSATGFSSFTVKGLDPATGKVLFILSCEYKKPTAAGQVGTDFSQMYQELLQGTLKPVT